MNRLDTFRGTVTQARILAVRHHTQRRTRSVVQRHPSRSGRCRSTRRPGRIPRLACAAAPQQEVYFLETHSFVHGVRALDVSTSGRYIDGIETIGLRELNQNPSKAVARVRAGVSLIVTDRGKPVLRMVPETEHPSTLQQMIAAGEARPPAEHGMPELISDLAPGLESLAALLVADRDRERNR